LGTQATKIKRQQDGTFSITFLGTTSAGTTTQDFDTIVLAAPDQFANLDIHPAPSIVPDEIPYVNLHVTLFTSPHYLSPTAFNLCQHDKVPPMLPTTLYTSEDLGADPSYKPKVGFNSISLLETRFNRRIRED
jgi:prenylcysteine oxidase/farnesylcysteine lyase